jgi:hypothetical protein
VPETGHCGAAGSVYVAFAIAVDDVDTIAANGEWQVGLAVARKYIAHESPNRCARRRTVSNPGSVNQNCLCILTACHIGVNLAG